MAASIAFAATSQPPANQTDSVHAILNADLCIKFIALMDILSPSTTDAPLMNRENEPEQAENMKHYSV